MKCDPIVNEVRQARQKILEDCGGDLEKLLDQLKAAETQDRTRVVSMKSHQHHFQRQGAQRGP
jgi:hypothetical protein